VIKVPAVYQGDPGQTPDRKRIWCTLHCVHEKTATPYTLP